MELKEIKDLLKSFDESESIYFEYAQGDVSLKLKKATQTESAGTTIVSYPTMPTAVDTNLVAGQQLITNANLVTAQPAYTAQPIATAQPVATAQSTPGAQGETLAEAAPVGEIVKAPLVGIFYAAPSPDSDAYVQVGSKVEEGQVLCLIEAMKMMSEITAPKSGTITKIYVKNQDVVGFEDPLFVIGE